MEVFLLFLIFGLLVSHTKGFVTLSVPAAGNCGEDTVLTCYVTGSIGFTGWFGLNRSLIINGDGVYAEDNIKYTQTDGTSSFNLTIHNTDITDQGEYRCKNGFDETQPIYLRIECKASAAAPLVTDEKKVTISVDKLYPSSPSLSTSFKKGSTDVTIPGFTKCTESANYPDYYSCVWTSSNSLADGSYTYSIVVTTIRQADPLTGSFKIVTPQQPVVSNTFKLNDNRVVVYGNEGQTLIIRCTSTGGYPTPTVVWYIDSVSSSNQLASTSAGTLQSDGTYTVTLQHTFNPVLADDMRMLICRSYYPQADKAYRGSKNTSVLLYLRLKPSEPTVSQIKNASVGGTVEVRCTTTGSRPVANITWSYQGSSYKGEETSTIDGVTETYIIVSVYKRGVTAADNGHKIQCVVTHPALVNPSEKISSIDLNVHFSVQASSTSITGNREITATGSTTLTLTCTTGSSNPASDIMWRNGSYSLTNNRFYAEYTGENNGVVRSQQLVLTPTRYMDGDVVTCLVSNIVSQSPETDTAILNLKYRALIEPMKDQVAVEGNTTQLECIALSKPVSTFRWYRQGQSAVIYEGIGTMEKNQVPYPINHVRRTDAGTYICEADNGIEMADKKSLSLTVYHPPDVEAITRNTTVKADSVSIICNASGIPNKQYFYGNWIQKWPKSDVTVMEYSASQKLELRNLTYEHSGVYSCYASNNVKVFGTDKEYIEGSVQLLVKSQPVITKSNEKVSAKLKEYATIEIDYFSNVGNSSVKFYKDVNGSRTSGVIYTVSKLPVDVILPVFTRHVQTSGIRALIYLRIDTKDDYSLYEVEVTNELGSTSRSVEVVPIGPPGTPSYVTISNVEFTSVNVSWVRGYHGGTAQTFVAEVSTDRVHWIQVTSVYGGMVNSKEPVFLLITVPKESASYFLRMYAFNEEGRSNFSRLVNFTTEGVEPGDNSEVSTSVTTGVVIGVSTALIIAIVFIVLFVLKRKQKSKKGKEGILVDHKTAGNERKRKNTIGEIHEMNYRDTSEGMYEQIKSDAERHNNRDVDISKAFESKNVYDSLNETVNAKPIYTSLTTAAL